MGYWHKVYLKRKQAEATTSTSGTVTLDLPERDYISQLMIVPYFTNTTFTYALLPAFYAIKKVEVLDGAEVIKSLSGSQLQALAYYWGRTPICPNRQDWVSTETFDAFFVRFGRFPGDTELMLDMAKLTNPQLKITYDFVTTSYYGISYTPPSTPTFKWTVLADIYRGTPPTPVKGFIRSQQIFDYTQVATGTEYVDIPRTEDIVGIMMQGGYIGKGLDQDFDRIRLNINTGELVPIDVYAPEMQFLQSEWFGAWLETNYRIEVKSGVQFDTGLGGLFAACFTSRGVGPYAYGIKGLMGGFLTPYVSDLATPSEYTIAHATKLKAAGIWPHHTMYLPMERLTRDGAFTLPARDYASILLELTSSSASASAKPNIVLETLGV